MTPAELYAQFVREDEARQEDLLMAWESPKSVFAVPAGPVPSEWVRGTKGLRDRHAKMADRQQARSNDRPRLLHPRATMNHCQSGRHVIRWREDTGADGGCKECRREKDAARYLARRAKWAAEAEKLGVPPTSGVAQEAARNAAKKAKQGGEQ